MNLTHLEERILCAIAETYPYSYKDVVRLYQRCSSFDKTIKVIKIAMKNGIDVMDVMDYFDK